MESLGDRQSIAMQGIQLNPDTRSARLWFVGYVRVFLTILVVAHHAGQPYGPTGGRWLIFNAERAEILGAFFSVNAAFFMGLFFLISGYFVPGAYDRKGAIEFLKDRLLRLGLPILFFTLFVFPLTLYLAEPRSLSFPQFIHQTYLKPRYIEFGHLWFLVHLLVYDVVYVVYRHLVKDKARYPHSIGHARVPSHPAIVTYLVVLAIVTFIVRMAYPIDQWEYLLGVIPAEIAHLPQYLSLFIVGIIAYRQNWLQRMPTQRGFTWLGIGLGAVLLRYAYTLVGSQLFATPLITGGGRDWRSLLWSAWEMTICVGLCIGLLVLFRERLNRQTRWGQMLSANAYTVYLFHLPIIFGIQFGVAELAISPLLKFLLVTLVGVPLCFLFSHYFRQIPLVSQIL